MTCTCFQPEELLSAGTKDQARAIYQDAKSRCKEHGKRCLIEGCEAVGTDDDLCPKHAHYFRVVLADPWYRNHPCPPEDAPQLPLHLQEMTEEA